MGAINKLMLHGCALLKHDRYIIFVHHILVMLIAPVVRIVVPMISCINHPIGGWDLGRDPLMRNPELV